MTVASRARLNISSRPPYASKSAVRPIDVVDPTELRHLNTDLRRR